MIDTIFSAPIDSLSQASQIWGMLKEWAKNQDKSDWKSHGYYITIHSRTLFFFNFLIENPNGISFEIKEEISKIFKDFGLTKLSVSSKPHPAHQ